MSCITSHQTKCSPEPQDPCSIIYVNLRYFDGSESSPFMPCLLVNIDISKLKMSYLLLSHNRTGVRTLIFFNRKFRVKQLTNKPYTWKCRARYAQEYQFLSKWCDSAGQSTGWSPFLSLSTCMPYYQTTQAAKREEWQGQHICHKVWSLRNSQSTDTSCAINIQMLLI